LLIDSRHKPLKTDKEFIQWLGLNKIPFVIVFTKIDKLQGHMLTNNINYFKDDMLKTWNSLPEYFMTSSINKTGRDSLFNYIENINSKTDFNNFKFSEHNI
jgi:GTP-binding protein